MDRENVKYGGFWIRAVGSLIDTALALVIIIPLIMLIYGHEYFTSATTLRGPAAFLINYIFPFLAVVLFWQYKSATPGKMVFKLIIVDADTLQKPTTKQLIIRYLSYYISALPFCLGFLDVDINYFPSRNN